MVSYFNPHTQCSPCLLDCGFLLYCFSRSVSCSSNHETDKGAIPETSKPYVLIVGCEIESHANNVILPVYLLCICYPLCNVGCHRAAHPLLRGLQTHMRTDISAHFGLPPAQVAEGVPPHLHPTTGNLACNLLEIMALTSLP